jgi:AbrB family looped-hinge helix DNA binding protein
MTKSSDIPDIDIDRSNVMSRINDNGRIVIPGEIRRRMGLQPGDWVVMSLEGEVLRVESHRAKVRKIQDEFRRFAKPNLQASGELVTERNQEARRETEEWLG